MTSKERVMTMLNHQKPDRIPKFDGFWSEFAEKCYNTIFKAQCCISDVIALTIYE